jgi:hypothetical protein
MRHYQRDRYGKRMNFCVQFNTIFTPEALSRKSTSWLFGVISRDVSPKTIAQYDGIHGVPLKTFTKKGSYHFSIGGLRSTCLSGETLNSQNEIDTFWFTLGVTFANIDPKRTLLSQHDWATVKRHSSRDRDGHFVHGFYESDRYEFQTDRIGLRTLYWTEHRVQYSSAVGLIGWRSFWEIAELSLKLWARDGGRSTKSPTRA